jgi:hypothetical protein
MEVMALNIDTVSLCTESRRISSSQNFMYVIIVNIGALVQTVNSFSIYESFAIVAILVILM